MDEVTEPRTRSWHAGDLLVDEGLARVRRGPEVIVLPRLSFELLCALVQAAPVFLSNEELMARVWPGLVVSPETVTQRVKLLRDALGDDPRQPRYIEGLRSRGYRFIGSVVARPAQLELGTPRPSSGSERAPRSWTSNALMWRWVLPLLVLGGTLSWWISRRAGEPATVVAPVVTDAATGSAAAQPGNTLAVLPFRTLSADRNDAYIGAGLSEAVQSRLANVRGLNVIARESASLAAARTGSPAAAGRRLGAGFVLDGSVRRDGDSIRVTATLLDSQQAAQLWSQQFDRDVADLPRIQDEIATQLVTALELRVANIAPLPARSQRSVNAQAYLAYLHGRVLVGRFTVREAETAATEFARAIDLDPGFALAYVALYDARMQAAALRRQPLTVARRQYAGLLERALQLDPDSGAAWFARAMWSGADATGTDAAFRRGVAQDPGNSRGLTAYSEFLDAQGREAEAKEMLEAALRVDPMAARARFRLAQRNFSAVGSDIEKYTLSVLELDPLYYPALQRYAKYRWQQHADIAQAIALIERAIAADPENPWGRHTAAAFYLDIGDAAAARAVVRGSAVAGASTRPMLATYEGDWRAAGEATLNDPNRLAFGPGEQWCVASALRDYALRAGQSARVETLLASQFDLPLTGTWQIKIFNFREAQLLSHLLLADGRVDEGRKHLLEVIDWIDANGRYGPVYNLRTKAQALMLLGRRDEALALLAESFVKLDYTHWWYTLERDPTWDPVRDDPRFRALARDVRAQVAAQRRALEELRARGEVPRRANPA